MKTIPIRFHRSACASLLAVLLSTACMTVNPEQNEAAKLIREGQYEQGIARLEQALKDDPNNVRLRADLLNARGDAVSRLAAAGNVERAAGRLDAARGLYERALAVDPGAERARAGLDELRRDQRHAEIIKGARAAFEKGDVEGAQAGLRVVYSENPQHVQARQLKRQIDERRARDLMAGPKLEAAFRKPVNLEFHDASIKMVFDALSRSTGINYILDKDIRPDLRTTIVTRQAPLEDAIDLILMTSQLEKKVLGPSAILIYPATPQKLKEYQDLVVKSFYLTSADVKQTQNLLKSVLKTRDIFIDEKLNLLVIRDTPEGVRLAEKLIAVHDIGEREVMLELEVLEVRRSRLLDLGIQWPDQLTLTPLPSTGSVTLRGLQNLSSGNIGATLSSAIINLKKQDGDVNLLANPRVRAKHKEKARILIGERVPVITTTATSTGFVSQNVQYLDVGLKLEIEPEVYLDGDVGMKVALEVSAITREILTSTGLLTYQVGTRNAATALRLKDGETQILAGLINDEDRRTANRVPGLGDMPVVGRLFSSQRDDQQKTEIVLSITPRLVRGLNRPDLLASEFWSGTETSLRTRPIMLGTVSPQDGQTLAISPSGGAPIAIGRPAGGAAGSGQAFLSLKAPETVKIGQEFSVDLTIKSDLPLRALPFQLGFDPAALQVVDVREGTFFQQGGVKTNFASNVDQKTGRVFVGLTRPGAEGAKGEARLVTITFRAQSPNAKSELRLLAATPVAAGSAAITVALPQPASINVTR